MADFKNPFVNPETLVAPVVEANKLAVANLEKLVEFQLGVLPAYVDLALSRARAAAEVTDVASAQAFAKDQVEAARAVNERLLADGKAFAELLAGFYAAYGRVARDNVAQFTPEAVKKAA